MHISYILVKVHLPIFYVSSSSGNSWSLDINSHVFLTWYSSTTPEYIKGHLMLANQIDLFNNEVTVTVFIRGKLHESYVFFCICLMRDVPLYYPPFCMIYQLNKSIFKEKMWAPVNIKTSIFNLRFLSHFSMDVYATKRAVYSSILVMYNVWWIKKRK